MNRFGFSLKWLLIAPTLVAIGAYTLVNESRPWIMVVSSGTGFVLLTALLAVVCQPSPGRAFWVGFAIFGWAYLLLAIVFDAGDFLVPTEPANELLYDLISRGGPDGLRDPPEPIFEYACHHMWAWLLALVGRLSGPVLLPRAARSG